MPDVSIPNFNQIQAVPGALLGPMDPSFLTPDSLLAYCETRMRSLDGDIQKHFRTQQSNIADSQAIDELLQDFKKAFSEAKKDDKGLVELSGGDGVAVHANGDLWNQVESKIQDPSAKAAIAKFRTAWQTAHDKGGKVTFDDVQRQILEPLDSAKGALRQGNEMGMIQLQAIMSQRQTAGQMTTNLVQSLGEQMKSITGNIGK